MSQSGRKFFDGYNVASSNFVYTANGSTGADDGWIAAKGENVVIQVCLATLQSTAASLIYRIEGRFDTVNRAASIYSDKLESTCEIDNIINIVERVKEIRVGARISDVPASPVASPTNFYAGICISEET